MNPVLILTHNNLELTKKAVESVYLQRLSHTSAHIVDNGSTDGTVDWAKEAGVLLDAFPGNYGVSAGWNHGLTKLFENDDCEHVLVIGNDTELPNYVYGALLSYRVLFVTGVAVDTMPEWSMPERMPLTANPDFSCFLISRECWDRVGKFNERLVNYCGDTDYHVRAHRLGLQLVKANVPYFHRRSSTMNNASPQERRVLNAQADADRGTFRAMYGCIPGEKGYDELFK